MDINSNLYKVLVYAFTFSVPLGIPENSLESVTNFKISVRVCLPGNTDVRFY